MTTSESSENFDFFKIINKEKLKEQFENKKKVDFSYHEKDGYPIIISNISEKGIYFIKENAQIIYIGIGIKNKSNYKLASRIKSHISVVFRGNSPVRMKILDTVGISSEKNKKKEFSTEEINKFNDYSTKYIQIYYIDCCEYDGTIIKAAEQYYINDNKDMPLLNSGVGLDWKTSLSKTVK